MGEKIHVFLIFGGKVDERNFKWYFGRHFESDFRFLCVWISLEYFDSDLNFKAKFIHISEVRSIGPRK